MPPGCANTFYFFWRDIFTLGVTLVFICVSGATVFIWRDFFLLGATFPNLARLFLSGVTFFVWRDFFIWRVFYAGAWVRTLFIPYYSVINIVINNSINPCIPLHTLVYLYIPSREDEVRGRIPMPHHSFLIFIFSLSSRFQCRA